MILLKRSIPITTIPVLLGILSCLAFLKTCERFEPKSELVFKTESVNVVSLDQYDFYGRIINIGDEPIQDHGFCWSVRSSPSINSTRSRLGSREEIGVFTSSVTGLALDTKFYVRAYITTESGTEYGEEMSFNSLPPNIPTVLTESVTDITGNSAQSGGEVTDNGGADVTSRGVCWGTATNPTISQAHTIDGSGIGTFTSAVKNLDCETTYYLRAYATNSAGAGYGNQVTFTTASCIFLPTVTTAIPTGLTQSSAICGGDVTSDGGAPVTARGICWSISPNPTLSDNTISSGSGTGSFTGTISGLICSNTYYARAYATNIIGTAYGPEVKLTMLECIPEPAELVFSDRDGTWRLTHEGVKTSFVTDANRDIEVFENKVYLKYGRNISIYNYLGGFLGSLTIDNRIFVGAMCLLPGGDFAFLNNSNDSVSFVSSSGVLLRKMSFTNQPPDDILQAISGLVVGNQLIISEDGNNHLIAINLDNYEWSVFKDFEHLPGWLGDIDYQDGTFYMCKSQEVYSFGKDEDAELICTLPEGNNIDIAVHGNFAYVTSNFGNKVYRINLQNGSYESFLIGLNYPQDMELLR
jgi:hypothetical protein